VRSSGGGSRSGTRRVVGVAGGVSEGHPSEGTLRDHCNDDVRRAIFFPAQPPVR
jgi:hypothetical protein